MYSTSKKIDFLALSNTFLATFLLFHVIWSRANPHSIWFLDGTVVFFTCSVINIYIIWYRYSTRLTVSIVLISSINAIEMFNSMLEIISSLWASHFPNLNFTIPAPSHFPLQYLFFYGVLTLLSACFYIAEIYSMHQLYKKPFRAGVSHKNLSSHRRTLSSELRDLSESGYKLSQAATSSARKRSRSSESQELSSSSESVDSQLAIARVSTDPPTLSEMLDKLDREIRTSVSTAVGALALLGGSSLSSNQSQYVAILEKAVESVSTVVQNSITLLKADMGAIPLDRSINFSVNSVIDDILGHESALETNQSVEVIRIISPDVPAGIIGDSTVIQTILTFLINNAAKYTKEGNITIRVRLGDKSDMPPAYIPNIPTSPHHKQHNNIYLVFEITDSGIGMEAGQLRIIKSAFSTRRHEYWAAPDSGPGLGIPTANRLALLFEGGKLEYDPNYTKGTKVTFGCLLKADSSSQTEPIQANPTGPHRVAILADTPLFQSMESLLQPKGLKCNQFHNHLSSERIVKKLFEARNAGHPYNLILLDLFFLGSSLEHFDKVRDLASQIKLGLGHVKIVLVVHAGIVEEVRSSVFDAYLLKPILASQLYLHASSLLNVTSMYPETDYRAIAGPNPNSPPQSVETLSEDGEPDQYEDRSTSYAKNRGASLPADQQRTNTSHHISQQDRPRSFTLESIPETGTAITSTLTRTARSNTAVDQTSVPGVLKRSSTALADSMLFGLKSLAKSDSPPPGGDIEGRLTILVAEDDLLNRHILETMIRRAGHICISESNGTGCLKRYQELHNEIDLLVMDIRMPIMDGFQATSKIREWEEKNQYPRVEIVGLTAEEGLKGACINVGMNDCWSKPLRKHSIESLLYLRSLSKQQSGHIASSSSAPKLINSSSSSSNFEPTSPNAITSTSESLPDSADSSSSGVSNSTGDKSSPVPASLTTSSSSPQENTKKTEPVFTVLLVEDNETVAKITISLVARAGMAIDWVRDGGAALETITKHYYKYKLVLMDLHLPVVGGMDCVKRIRALEAEKQLDILHIVALTGDTKTEHHNQCLSAGFNSVFSKPLNYPALISWMNRFFKRAPDST